MKKLLCLFLATTFILSCFLNVSYSASLQKNDYKYFENLLKNNITVEKGITIIVHELGLDKNLPQNPPVIYDSKNKKPSAEFSEYIAAAKRYLPKVIPPFNSNMTRIFAVKFILSILNCNLYDSQNPLDLKIVKSVLTESKIISADKENDLYKPVTGEELKKLINRVKIKITGVDMAKPAWEAYSQGKLEDAEYIFKRCISAGLHIGTTQSYLANSYYGLGLVYAHHNNKRYYDAYVMLNQAIKLDNGGKIGQAARKYLIEKLPPYELDLNYQTTKEITYEEVMALVGHHLSLNIKEVPTDFVAKDANGKEPSPWAAPYVKLAYYRKNIPSVPSSFNDIAPRYWIAAYICNVKGLMHYDYETYFNFKDLGNLDTNYKMYVSVAVDRGLIMPVTEDTFSPYSGIKRTTLGDIIKNLKNPKIPQPKEIKIQNTPKLIATYFKGVEPDQIDILEKKSNLLDMVNFDAVMLGIESPKEDTKNVATYFYNADLSKAIKIANDLKISTFLSLSNLNNGKFDPALTHNFIKDDSKRKSLADELIKLVDKYNLTGVHIDFEHLYSSDKDNLTEFIKILSEKLRSKNKKLTMVIGAYMSDAEANKSVYDFEKLSEYVDYFNLILYDDFPKGKYPSTGIDGPISNIVRIERVLKYMTLRIPPSKILMGVGAYGIDFNITNKTAENVKLDYIPDIIKNAKTGSVKYLFDSQTQSPYLEFTNPDGTVHRLWYENKKSLEERMKIVHKYNLAGICFYWLGSNTDEIYQVFQKYLKPKEK